MDSSKDTMVRWGAAVAGRSLCRGARGLVALFAAVAALAFAGTAWADGLVKQDLVGDAQTSVPDPAEAVSSFTATYTVKDGAAEGTYISSVYVNGAPAVGVTVGADVTSATLTDLAISADTRIVVATTTPRPAAARKWWENPVVKSVYTSPADGSDIVGCNWSLSLAQGYYVDTYHWTEGDATLYSLAAMEKGGQDAIWNVSYPSTLMGENVQMRGGAVCEPLNVALVGAYADVGVLSAPLNALPTADNSYWITCLDEGGNAFSAGKAPNCWAFSSDGRFAYGSGNDPYIYKFEVLNGLKSAGGNLKVVKKWTVDGAKKFRSFAYAEIGGKGVIYAPLEHSTDSTVNIYCVPDVDGDTINNTGVSTVSKYDQIQLAGSKSSTPHLYVQVTQSSGTKENDEVLMSIYDINPDTCGITFFKGFTRAEILAVHGKRVLDSSSNSAPFIVSDDERTLVSAIYCYDDSGGAQYTLLRRVIQCGPMAKVNWTVTGGTCDGETVGTATLGPGGSLTFDGTLTEDVEPVQFVLAGVTADGEAVALNRDGETEPYFGAASYVWTAPAALTEDIEVTLAVTFKDKVTLTATAQAGKGTVAFDAATAAPGGAVSGTITDVADGFVPLKVMVDGEAVAPVAGDGGYTFSGSIAGEGQVLALFARQDAWWREPFVRAKWHDTRYKAESSTAASLLLPDQSKMFFGMASGNSTAGFVRYSTAVITNAIGKAADAECAEINLTGLRDGAYWCRGFTYAAPYNAVLSGGMKYGDHAPIWVNPVDGAWLDEGNTSYAVDEFTDLPEGITKGNVKLDLFVVNAAATRLFGVIDPDDALGHSGQLFEFEVVPGTAENAGKIASFKYVRHWESPTFDVKALSIESFNGHDMLYIAGKDDGKLTVLDTSAAEPRFVVYEGVFTGSKRVYGLRVTGKQDGTPHLIAAESENAPNDNLTYVFVLDANGYLLSTDPVATLPTPDHAGTAAGSSGRGAFVALDDDSRAVFTRSAGSGDFAGLLVTVMEHKPAKLTVRGTFSDAAHAEPDRLVDFGGEANETFTAPEGYGIQSATVYGPEGADFEGPAKTYTYSAASLQAHAFVEMATIPERKVTWTAEGLDSTVGVTTNRNSMGSAEQVVTSPYVIYSTSPTAAREIVFHAAAGLVLASATTNGVAVDLSTADAPKFGDDKFIFLASGAADETVDVKFIEGYDIEFDCIGLDSAPVTASYLGQPVGKLQPGSSAQFSLQCDNSAYDIAQVFYDGRLLTPGEGGYSVDKITSSGKFTVVLKKKSAWYAQPFARVGWVDSGVELEHATDAALDTSTGTVLFGLGDGHSEETGGTGLAQYDLAAVTNAIGKGVAPTVSQFDELDGARWGNRFTVLPGHGAAVAAGTSALIHPFGGQWGSSGGGAAVSYLLPIEGTELGSQPTFALVAANDDGTRLYGFVSADEKIVQMSVTYNDSDGRVSQVGKIREWSVEQGSDPLGFCAATFGDNDVVYLALSDGGFAALDTTKTENAVVRCETGRRYRTLAVTGRADGMPHLVAVAATDTGTTVDAFALQPDTGLPLSATPFATVDVTALVKGDSAAVESRTVAVLPDDETRAVFARRASVDNTRLQLAVLEVQPATLTIRSIVTDGANVTTNDYGVTHGADDTAVRNAATFTAPEGKVFLSETATPETAPGSFAKHCPSWAYSIGDSSSLVRHVLVEQTLTDKYEMTVTASGCSITNGLDNATATLDENNKYVCYGDDDPGKRRLFFTANDGCGLASLTVNGEAQDLAGSESPKLNDASYAAALPGVTSVGIAFVPPVALQIEQVGGDHGTVTPNQATAPVGGAVSGTIRPYSGFSPIAVYVDGAAATLTDTSVDETERSWSFSGNIQTAGKITVAYANQDAWFLGDSFVRAAWTSDAEASEVCHVAALDDAGRLEIVYAADAGYGALDVPYAAATNAIHAGPKGTAATPEGADLAAGVVASAEFKALVTLASSAGTLLVRPYGEDAAAPYVVGVPGGLDLNMLAANPAGTKLYGAALNGDAHDVLYGFSLDANGGKIGGLMASGDPVALGGLVVGLTAATFGESNVLFAVVCDEKDTEDDASDDEYALVRVDATSGVTAEIALPGETAGSGFTLAVTGVAGGTPHLVLATAEKVRVFALDAQGFPLSAEPAIEQTKATALGGAGAAVMTDDDARAVFASADADGKLQLAVAERQPANLIVRGTWMDGEESVVDDKTAPYDAEEATDVTFTAPDEQFFISAVVDGVAVENFPVRAEYVYKFAAGGKSHVLVELEAADALPVTFDLQGKGGETPGQQMIACGLCATAPDAPAADDVEGEYQFGGWFTDKDCTAAFDFATPITAATTLYAQWKPGVTVTKDENVTGVSWAVGGGAAQEVAFGDGDSAVIYAPSNAVVTFTAAPTPAADAAKVLYHGVATTTADAFEPGAAGNARNVSSWKVLNPGALQFSAAEGATGVTVNGLDAGWGGSDATGAAWSWDKDTSKLTLKSAGPYELAGENADGEVQIVAQDGAAATFNGLALTGGTPFAVAAGASATVTILGSSTLTGGAGCPAVDVGAGQTLVVRSAAAAELPEGLQTLALVGGEGAPAVGGKNGGETFGMGSVTVASGVVTATAGADTSDFAGTLAVTGGSVKMGHGGASVTAGGETPAFCVTAAVGAGVAPAFSQTAAYDLTGVKGDAAGNVHLWLPAGRHSLNAGAKHLVALVTDAAVAAKDAAVSVAGAYYAADELDAAAKAAGGTEPLELLANVGIYTPVEADDYPDALKVKPGEFAFTYADSANWSHLSSEQDGVTTYAICKTPEARLARWTADGGQTTNYTFFTAALAAVEANADHPDAITLLRDVTLAAATEIARPLTLDLGGKTLTMNPIAGMELSFTAGGTVSNGTIECDAESPTKIYGLSFYGCSALVKDVQIRAANAYYALGVDEGTELGERTACAEGHVVRCENVDVTGTGRLFYCEGQRLELDENCSAVQTGAIDASAGHGYKQGAIVATGLGEITVEGGSYSSDAVVLSNGGSSPGSIDVEGGTFTATGDGVLYDSWMNAASYAEMGVAVLLIEGGEFIGPALTVTADPTVDPAAGGDWRTQIFVAGGKFRERPVAAKCAGAFALTGSNEDGWTAYGQEITADDDADEISVEGALGVTLAITETDGPHVYTGEALNVVAKSVTGDEANLPWGAEVAFAIAGAGGAVAAPTDAGGYVATLTLTLANGSEYSVTKEFAVQPAAADDDSGIVPPPEPQEVAGEVGFADAGEGETPFADEWEITGVKLVGLDGEEIDGALDADTGAVAFDEVAAGSYNVVVVGEKKDASGVRFTNTWVVAVAPGMAPFALTDVNPLMNARVALSDGCTAVVDGLAAEYQYDPTLRDVEFTVAAADEAKANALRMTAPEHLWAAWDLSLKKNGANAAESFAQISVTLPFRTTPCATIKVWYEHNGVVGELPESDYTKAGETLVLRVSKFSTYAVEYTLDAAASDGYNVTKIYDGVETNAAKAIEVEHPAAGLYTLKYSTDGRDGVYGTAEPAFTAAGTHEVWYAIESADPNWASTTNRLVVNILPRPITLTSASATNYWCGTAFSAGGVIVGGSGYADGETFAYGGFTAYAGEDKVGGAVSNEFAIVAGGTADPANYQLAVFTGELVVLPSAARVSTDGGATWAKGYGSLTAAFADAASGALVEMVTNTSESVAVAPAAAAEYALSLGGGTFTGDFDLNENAAVAVTNGVIGTEAAFLFGAAGGKLTVGDGVVVETAGGFAGDGAAADLVAELGGIWKVAPVGLYAAGSTGAYLVSGDHEGYFKVVPESAVAATIARAGQTFRFLSVADAAATAADGETIALARPLTVDGTIALGASGKTNTIDGAGFAVGRAESFGGALFSVGAGTVWFTNLVIDAAVEGVRGGTAIAVAAGAWANLGEGLVIRGAAAGVDATVSGARVGVYADATVTGNVANVAVNFNTTLRLADSAFRGLVGVTREGYMVAGEDFGTVESGVVYADAEPGAGFFADGDATPATLWTGVRTSNRRLRWLGRENPSLYDGVRVVGRTAHVLEVYGGVTGHEDEDEYLDLRELEYAAVADDATATNWISDVYTFHGVVPLALTDLEKNTAYTILVRAAATDSTAASESRALVAAADPFYAAHTFKYDATDILDWFGETATGAEPSFDELEAVQGETVSVMTWAKGFAHEGYYVTLGADLPHDIAIPEDAGALALDLNGHNVVGDGSNDAVVTFTKVAGADGDFAANVLLGTGDGHSEIRGKAGADGVDGEDTHDGGFGDWGQDAIATDDWGITGKVKVELVGDLLVQGGDGGDGGKAVSGNGGAGRLGGAGVTGAIDLKVLDAQVAVRGGDGGAGGSSTAGNGGAGGYGGVAVGLDAGCAPIIGAGTFEGGAGGAGGASGGEGMAGGAGGAGGAGLKQGSDLAHVAGGAFTGGAGGAGGAGTSGATAGADGAQGISGQPAAPAPVTVVRATGSSITFALDAWQECEVFRKSDGSPVAGYGSWTGCSDTMVTNTLSELDPGTAYVITNRFAANAGRGEPASFTAAIEVRTSPWTVDAIAALFDNNATVVMGEDGTTITLTDDVGHTVALPAELDDVTLDLNGHVITGTAGTTEAPDGGAAIQFTVTAPASDAQWNPQTVLAIVNGADAAGGLVGGNGKDAPHEQTTVGFAGGAGGAAVAGSGSVWFPEESAGEIALAGGNGGRGSDANNGAAGAGGAGGAAVAVTGDVGLYNAQVTLQGGAGGAGGDVLEGTPEGCGGGAGGAGGAAVASELAAAVEYVAGELKGGAGGAGGSSRDLGAKLYGGDGGDGGSTGVEGVGIGGDGGAGGAGWVGEDGSEPNEWTGHGGVGGSGEADGKLGVNGNGTWGACPRTFAYGEDGVSIVQGCSCAEQAHAAVATLVVADGTYTGEEVTNATCTLEEATPGAWLATKPEVEILGDCISAGVVTAVLSTVIGETTWAVTNTYEILPAALAGVSAAQESALVYTGAAQTPAVTAEATTVDGTDAAFAYALAKEGPYGELPQFTDAGTYVVWYAATAANHAAVTGSFDVVVAPAALAGVSAAQDGALVYTGAAQTPAVTAAATAVGGAEVAFAYALAENGPYGELPQFTLPGAYTVWYAATAANHAAVTGSFDVVVAPAALADVEVQQSVALTYTGRELKPQVSATATAQGGQTVKFTYSLAADGEYAATVPGVTAAGVYTVHYKASANHHDEKSGTFEVTVSPKELTVTAHDLAITYGEARPAAPGVEISGFVGGDDESMLDLTTLVYDFDGAGEVPDAGTYAITPDGLAAPANYKIAYVPGTLTVNQKDLGDVLIAQTGALKYNGRGQRPEWVASTNGVPITDGDGFSFTWGLAANGAFGAEMPALTNAGEYVIYYRTTAGGGNYKAGSGSFTATVGRRTVELVSGTVTNWWSGMAATCAVVVTNGDGFVAADDAAGVAAEGADFAFGEGLVGDLREGGRVENAFDYTLWANTLAENYEITTAFGEIVVKPGVARATLDGGATWAGFGDVSNAVAFAAAAAEGRAQLLVDVDDAETTLVVPAGAAVTLELNERAVPGTIAVKGAGTLKIVANGEVALVRADGAALAFEEVEGWTVKTAEGGWTIARDDTKAARVTDADGNEVFYASFDEAVDAIRNSNLTGRVELALWSDATAPTTPEEQYFLEWSNAIELTIEGNGFTMDDTARAEGVLFSPSFPLTIRNLTFAGGAGSALVQTYNGSCGGNGAVKVTLEGVTVTGYTGKDLPLFSNVDVPNGVTLELIDTTIRDNDVGAVVVAGYDADADPYTFGVSSYRPMTVRVKGATFVQDNGGRNVVLASAERLVLAGDFTGAVGVSVDEKPGKGGTAGAGEGGFFGVAAGAFDGAENFFSDDNAELVGACAEGGRIAWSRPEAVEVEVTGAAAGLPQKLEVVNRGGVPTVDLTGFVTDAQHLTADTVITVPNAGGAYDSLKVEAPRGWTATVEPDGDSMKISFAIDTDVVDDAVIAGVDGADPITVDATSVALGVANAVPGFVYRLEYSTDGGSAWTVAVSARATGETVNLRWVPPSGTAVPDAALARVTISDR